MNLYLIPRTLTALPFLGAAVLGAAIDRWILPSRREVRFRAAVPLARAVVCIGCEMLSETDGGSCPACGERELWPLARWLDRTTQHTYSDDTWPEGAV